MAYRHRFPFDRENYTPKDDRAKLLEFQATGQPSNCLVWLPAFFTPKTMEDLGRLVCSIISSQAITSINMAATFPRSSASRPGSSYKTSRARCGSVSATLCSPLTV